MQALGDTRTPRPIDHWARTQLLSQGGRVTRREWACREAEAREGQPRGRPLASGSISLSVALCRPTSVFVSLFPYLCFSFCCVVEIDSWTKAKAAALHPYRLPALPAVRTADIGAAAAQGRASCPTSSIYSDERHMERRYLMEGLSASRLSPHRACTEHQSTWS